MLSTVFFVAFLFFWYLEGVFVSITIAHQLMREVRMHTFCGCWLRFKSTQNLAIFTIKPMTATTKNLICKCVAIIFNRSSIFAFKTAPIKSSFMSARLFFFLPLPRFPILRYIPESE